MTPPRRVGRLHLLTDETLQSRFSHVKLAGMAVEGGADAVQYREKRAVSREARVEVARAMARRVEGGRTSLIVNDSVEIALACGAAGVHLGREDSSPELARERLGGELLVGATANDVEEALRVGRGPVDYLGVGPVFGTTSKARPAPVLGLDSLRRIVSLSSRRVIAIGGIGLDNLDDVLETGVHGVAVLSAFAGASDPAAVARELMERIVAFHRATLPRLMLVTDRLRTRGRDLVSLVAQAAKGGVGIVQVREKDLTADRLRELVQRIRENVPANVRLQVNSSSRVARTMRTGLHLPAASPLPGGNYSLLGRSVHDAIEARSALADRPDYLLLGTIFPTESKPGHPGSGVELVRQVAERARPVPVYAIGGVTVAGIPALIRAGAHGVAVCGAILSANDPRRVAEAMTLSLQVACRAARNGPANPA